MSSKTEEDSVESKRKGRGRNKAEEWAAKTRGAVERSKARIAIRGDGR